MGAMRVVKRVIIFLLVVVGIFTTVEFINLKIEAAHHWGVHMDYASSKTAAVKQTASTKTYHTHKHKGVKKPAVSS